MPRSPKLSCSRCNRPMWQGRGALLNGGVCQQCRRANPVRKPLEALSTDNPYGLHHLRRREQLLPCAIGTLCPICGQVMLASQKLHLDHSIPLRVDPTSVGDRIVHGRCNAAWRSGGRPPQTPEERKQRDRERAKRTAFPGQTTKRGYGAKHQRLRADWKKKVDRGGVGCARCGKAIIPGTPWHLDHADDRSGYLGPSHRKCNIRAAIKRKWAV